MGHHVLVNLRKIVLVYHTNMVAIMQENIIVGHQHILAPCNRLHIMSAPLLKRVRATVVKTACKNAGYDGVWTSIDV